MTYHNTTVRASTMTRRPPLPTKATTPTDQLEIAAQWLSEAALATDDTYVRLNAERVAHECLAMARRT